MEEVELFIRGKEDDRRIQRLCAYRIVEGWRGSNQMSDITSFIPLPYDFEMKPRTEELTAIYEEAIKNFPETWN